MTRLGSPRASRTEAVVVVGFCAYIVLLAAATRLWTYDLWGGLLVAPVLLAGSVPVLRLMMPRNPGLFRLLVLALVVKLVMALPRWWVAFSLYGGSADASRYNDAGKVLAESYRTGVFPWPDSPGGLGTQVMEAVTGGVYAVIGPTVIGGFLVFSWIGFCGLVAMFQAARTAVPELDEARYAVLLFFLPSMAFWPSSIGKEAVITLGIGLAVLGAAWLYTYRVAGWLPLAAGLALVSLIRPHVAGMVAGAVVVGLLLRRARRRTLLTPIARIVTATVVVAAGSFFLTQTADQAGLDSLSLSAVEEELSRAAGNTSQGGSEFAGGTIDSVADVPTAVLTVFFRPFLWEANNLQVLIAAIEGSGLLALTVLSGRRLRTALGARRNAYIIMALLYLCAFVYAFSAFGNFGILARQRVQAVPFLVLLLSLHPSPRIGRRWGSPARRTLTPAPSPAPSSKLAGGVHDEHT